jgi:sec-independent protein translocase protein TatB
MFDIAFSELVVIAIVALIVIGPEKLPKVARTLGALTGRMQRYMAQVKEEVNREARFEELQQLQQEIKATVTQSKTNAQQKIDQLTQQLDFENKPAETQLEAKPTATDHPSKE